MAKDSNAEEKDKVLGVAMWMPPKPTGTKESWDEWLEGWKLWAKQVGMNLWYGRGGLNVKVCLILPDRKVTSAFRSVVKVGLQKVTSSECSQVYDLSQGLSFQSFPFRRSRPPCRGL